MFLLPCSNFSLDNLDDVLGLCMLYRQLAPFPTSTCTSGSLLRSSDTPTINLTTDTQPYERLSIIANNSFTDYWTFNVHCFVFPTYWCSDKGFEYVRSQHRILCRIRVHFPGLESSIRVKWCITVCLNMVSYSSVHGINSGHRELWHVFKRFQLFKWLGLVSLLIRSVSNVWG